MKKTISIALLALFGVIGSVSAQDKKSNEQETAIRETMKELEHTYKLSQSQQSAVKHLLDYKYSSTDSKENIQKTLEGRFKALLGDEGYKDFKGNTKLFKKVME